MAFDLGNGIWNGVFAVPQTVVDEHIKIASGLSYKVLLLLLRHGGQLEPDAIAEMVGQSVADVQDALNFWIASGVIARAQSNFSQKQLLEQPAPALQYTVVPDEREPLKPKEDERVVETISASRRKLSTRDINELAENDETIGYLLQEAQAVLGKTLTPVSTETVVALYSYHGMQPDLILMLMHYCKSIGKDNMRYIEKVAADWLDKGIDTHEKAEAEILRQTKRSTVEGKIKAAFGIHDRSLIPNELKYIQTWTEEYRMELPLITLAYERAVELKGKLSFPYINGILTNWHNKGIQTTAKAMQEKRENTGKAQPQKQQVPSSYDISELENLIAQNEIL